MRRAVFFLLLVLCAVGVARAATAGSSELKFFDIVARAHAGASPTLCASEWKSPSGECDAIDYYYSLSPLSFKGASLRLSWCEHCYTHVLPEHPRTVRLCNTACSSELLGKIIRVNGSEEVFSVVGGKIDGKAVLPDDHNAGLAGDENGPLRVTFLNSPRAIFLITGYIKVAG